MEVKNLEEILSSFDGDLPVMNEDYRQNIEWLIESRNKLSKYENNWIAVYQKEMVGFCSNPIDLEQQVRDKGIDPARTVFHFLVNSNCIF